MFEDEYNLRSLQKINQDGFSMYVTPRYLYHYVQNKYEQFSTEILKNYLTKESTFVDIGAHFGYYSLLADSVYPGIKVVALEPVETTFNILAKNVKLNKINAEIYNLAASNKEEIKTLNVTEASDSVGFYKHPMTKTKYRKKIRCVTVDSVLNNINNISFIKIDVEGHEISVLQGIQSTLKNNPTAYLLVELCPQLQINAGHKPDDLLKELFKLNYELFMIDENNRKYYRLKGNKYSTAELMGNNTYCNIFCVPKSKALLTCYVSHTSMMGGAERVLLDLMTQTQKYNGISHVILPSPKGLMTKKLLDLAISSDVVNYVWWTKKSEQKEKNLYFKSFLNFIGYIKELEKINPHVILTNTIVIPWGGIIAKLLGIPHIWCIHEFGERDHGFKFLFPLKEVLKTIDQLSDMVVYNSKAVERYYKKMIPVNKSRVVYFNVFNNPLSKMKKRVFKYKNSLRIIILGFIAESKGQNQIAQAVVDLLKTGENIELMLLGKYKANNMYYKKVVDLINHNQDRIYINNYVNNPQDYLNQADLVVVCSRDEAFGRSAIEGMMLGKPVLMSDRGSYEEIVKNGYNGYVYRYGDIDDLKNKIRFCIKSKKQLNKMGQNAYKYAMDTFNRKISANQIYKYGMFVKNFKTTSGMETREIIEKFFSDYVLKIYTDYTHEHELLNKIIDSKFYRFWRFYRRIVEKNI